ncbi:hypothetical protein L2E82_19558 [Cichorium intybus]|uniref:Uncharacterized protein n=1 Tax=Cichorium intybus TaxID=13427 RepID=A0ACB9FBI7_CICIN|nr:hypothetical protein L2E82_19558 [Cichorium intybus]
MPVSADSRQASREINDGGFQGKMSMTWIVYNKPEEPNVTHACLSLALGLHEQHSSSNHIPESSFKGESDPFGLDSLIPNTLKKDEKVKAKLDVEATTSKIRKEEDEEAKRFLKLERETLILCLEIAAKRRV